MSKHKSTLREGEDHAAPPTREALTELLKNVPEWNEWKKTQVGTCIDLSGIDLRGAALREADLVDADLRGADLRRADLTNAKLNGADLSPLPRPTAPPTPTDLTDADLTGADLSGADLKGAILIGTNCSRAKLEARNLCFDHTLTRDAYLAPNASDLWSVLRRRYTGPRMVFNLVFLAAFFLPLGFRATAWTGVSEVQRGILAAIDTALVAAVTLVEEESPARAALSEVRQAVERAIPGHESSEGWRQVPLWQLVVGAESGSMFWALSVTLIIYNMLRWMLTRAVAPLRDEEERSGMSPAYRTSLRPMPLQGHRTSPKAWVHSVRSWRREALTSYGWLRWPDRVVQVLFWVAVSAFVLNLKDWLDVSVWVRDA